MIHILFAAGLAAAAAAAAPEDPARREISAVFAKAAGLVASQAGKDAREIARSDSEIAALAPSVLKWKWRAVEPLTRIVSDPAADLKVRVYALSFLGLTRDPLAFPVMKGLLWDRHAAPVLRSAAAQDIPRLGISPGAARSALCAALDDEGLPEEVARTVLSETARLGCEQPRVLEHWVMHYGPAPKGMSQDAARLALNSLGRSRPLETVRVLLRLLEIYPPASDMRPVVLRALWEKREAAAALKDQTASILTSLLKSGSDHPAAASVAIPLLASLRDPAHVPFLLRFLKDPDAEVVTVTAEALAELQVFPARAEITRILAHAHADPRFMPAPGRPDPAALMERLQAAEKRLR